MGFPTLRVDDVGFWSRQTVSIPGRDLWVFRLWRALNEEARIQVMFQSLVGIYGFSDPRSWLSVADGLVSIPGRDLWVFRPKKSWLMIFQL